MTTPSEEYLIRRMNAGLLALSGLHHYLMDRVFVDFDDGFSFDDVLQKAAADPKIFESVAIAGNGVRLKVFVIRVIEGLVSVGMLREVVSDVKRYYRSVNPTP
jgi:hypothetical protein